MVQFFRNAFRSLAKDEKGNVLILVALSAFLLILSIGAAIDMTRAQILQLKMYSALDAANLAAGAAASNPPPGYTEQQWVDSEVSKFFNANFPTNYLESSTVVIPSATLSNGGNTIDISASATQSTSFMAAVGTPTVKVAAASEVTRASNVGMELVLALDNTGSMADAVDPSTSSTSKIVALQSAATELVNILYGTNTSIPNFFVGIVPFTQTVNIGTSHTSWLGSLSSNHHFPSSTPWGGCVESRAGTGGASSLDVSDTPPSTSTTLFIPYFYPNVSASNQVPTSADVCTASQGWCNIWSTSVDQTNTAFVSLSSTPNAVGPNAECPQPITPMTTDKATILSGINSMVPEGQTLIDLGLAWAYRLLSPNWQGYWGGEMNSNGLPLAYNTPNMQKVVILMTDGMNYVGDPTVYPGLYNAYGFLDGGNFPTSTVTTSAQAVSYLDSQTEAVCDAMKANGIIIYTIGFGTTDDDDPSNPTSVNGPLLKYCATDINHYFLAPTNAQLEQDFTAIGNALANLRISK